MSTTIDDKVVEMRFDNKQFEDGVNTSMSTLEKLKKSLNLDGAAKSFEQLDDAAKKCDMSTLSRSVQTVSEKFSALETIAVGALLKIGSQVATTGEQVLKSLTVDQVTAGWEKYADKTTAVQTIMAATGKSIDEVNSSLGKLIWFTDETSYSMTDMTSNIGKFTSQGVELDAAVTSMQGISTWAALSGGTINEASRAMYNLSQALGVGAVKLMDWKSIENANMATKEFKEMAMEAAVATGDLTKSFDAAGNAIYQTSQGTEVTAANFSSTLQDAWFSSDALIEVLSNYGSYADGVYELYNNLADGVDKTTSEIIQDLKDLKGAEDHTILDAGYTEDQIDLVRKLSEEVGGVGQKSFAAAQEAKTFTEVLDSVKEAVASGWAQTFETIFGNYEEAKVLWTDLANELYDVFAEGGNARNELLSEALSDSGFDRFKSVIQEAGIEVETFEEKLAAVAESRDLSLESIISEYGSLEEAIQNGAVSVDMLSEAVDKCADGFSKMEFDELHEALDGVIDGVDELTGREHLISAFWNTWEGARTLLSTFTDAFHDIFPTATADQIYNFAKGLDELTASFKTFLTETEEGQKLLTDLTNTFKGAFAIVDIIGQAISALVRTIAPAGTVVGDFLTGVLGLTGSFGEWLTNLDEVIRENDLFYQGLQRVGDILNFVGEQVGVFLQKIAKKLNLPTFDELTENLDGIYNLIKDKFDQEGLERIQGFIDRVKALDSISLENIQKVLLDFKENILDYFFDFGTVTNAFSEKFRNVFHEICNFIDETKANGISGLNAIVEFFLHAKDKIFGIALEIRSKLADKIGFGEIFAIGLGTAMVAFTKKIADAFEVIAAPLEGIGNVLNSAGTALSAFALKIKAEALLTAAKAILVLVGALAVLTLLDQDKLKDAVITLGILAAGVLAFSFAMSKMGKPAELTGMSVSLVSLGAGLLLMASAFKKLDGLENVGRSFAIITGLMIELAAISKLIGSKGNKGGKSSSEALSLIAFAVSLKLLVSAIKDIDRMEINNAGKTVGILFAAVTSLIAMSVACRSVQFTSGAAMLGMVVSLKVLISAFNDLAELDAGTTKTALKTLLVIFGMFAGVMAASNLAGENASKAGAAIMQMSAALTLIVLAIKMMEDIDPIGLERTKKAIAEFLVVFALVTAASHFAGQNAAKAGAMLLLMSGAILILSTAMALLAHLDPTGLDRALTAVTQLLLVFGALVAVTKFSGEAEKAQGTLAALTVALAVMAGSVAALSLLDPQRLAGATTALSVLMGVFSLLIASTHFAEKAKGTLVVMTLVVAGIAGILTAMSALHVENAISNAAALSLLITTMSASLIILSKVGSVAPTAYGAIAVMTAIVAALGLILVGVSSLDVQPSIETAASLSILLLSLSAACLLLTGVGAAGAAAFVGIGALTALIAAMGGVMAAICALTSDNPTIEADLDRAIMILEKIGTGLGSVIGGFVGGAIGGLSSGLPIIGENLSAFMINAQTFFDSVRSLDAETLSGIASLSGSLLLITGANFLEKITSWATGGSSMTDFATQLVAFGKGIVNFSNVVADIDPGVVTSAATAGKALASMASEIPNSGGLVSKFAGNNDLGDFAQQLVPFGKAIAAFSKVVVDVDPSVVASAATAGEALSQMASTLPNSGGVIGVFAGNNDLGDFAQQLVPFGKAMAAFSKVVVDVKPEVVTSAATAGEAIANMASTLPNSGGLISKLAGDNNLVDFAQQLVPFGKAIAAFSKVVVDVDPSVVASAATAGQAISQMASTLPNSGGLISKLAGDNTLSDFAQQLIPFGMAMKSYGEAVADINPDTIAASAVAAQTLSTLQANLPNIGSVMEVFTGGNDLGRFAEGIIPFGAAMKSYGEAVANINPATVASSATAAQALSTLQSNLPNVGSVMEIFVGGNDLATFAEGIIPFGEAMKSYGEAVSGINPDAVSSSAIAAQALATLQANLPNVGGVMEFFTGGNDLGKFAEGIAPFGEAMKAYGEAVADINPEAVTASATAAKTLSELQNSLPNTGGVISWFTGDSDFGNFSDGIIAFGDAMKSYGDAVADINPESITASTIAAQSLVELQSILPSIDEISSFFSGNTDFGQFSSGIVPFGTAMTSYGQAVAGIDSQSISASAIAAQSLVELQSSLPQIEGVMEFFSGGTDFSTLSEGLNSFGEAMTSYSSTVSGIKSSVVTSSVTAGKALVELTGLLGKCDGLSGVFGNNSFAGFGENIVQFGEYLSSYSNTVGDVSLETVTVSTNAAQVLLGFSNGISGNSQTLTSFGTNIVAFGKNLAEYNSNVAGIDSSKLSSVITQVRSLADLAKDLSGTDSTAFSSFSNALKDMANSGISELISAFSNSTADVTQAVQSMLDSVSSTIASNQNIATPGMEAVMSALSTVVTTKSSEIKSAVTTMMTDTATTISGSSSSIQSAMNTALSGAVSAMNSFRGQAVSATNSALSAAVSAANGYSGQFQAAGRNAGQGLVIGIQSMLGSASSAGRSLALAALNAAKSALDSHSPSREFIYLGENIGEGLAIGINNSIVPAAEAASGMIDEVLEVAGKGIEKFQEWAEEKKYYGELSLMDELAGYENLQAKYKAGSEERIKIDREIYRIQNELVASTYQASIDWIEEEKFYNRISKQEELEALELMQTRYMEGSEIRKKIDREIYTLRNDLMDESYQHSMNWIDEEKYYNRLSLDEELAAYERVQARYEKGSEEWKKMEREKYRVKNEIMSASYQHSMDWIEREKYYNRLSLEEELAAYERVQARYEKGTEEWEKMEREKYRVQKELLDASYQHSMDWIEEEKYYKRMSLADELAAYTRVQSRYAKGTAERKKMDREIYRLEQEIYEAQKQYIADVQRLQEQANQRRMDLEQEYADKVKSINEKLEQDIKAVNDEYENALKSRENSLYSSYGLFDEVTEKEEVSAETLMKNLEGQVKEFGEWQDILSRLSARGLDSDLIGELQEMGPSAIAQIKALNSMSDSELEKYADLWAVKHGQARAQAVSELEGLRIETQNNIVQLRADAEVELEEYRATWQQKMDQITVETNAELEKLREDFAKQVGLLKANTEEEMQEMADSAKEILELAGWDKTGQEIVSGITEGIEAKKGSFLDTLTEMALAGVEAVKDTLEINSPSRVFKELGNFTGLGFVQGLSEYADKSYTTASDMAEYAANGLSDALSSVSSFASGEYDIQPSIRPVLDFSDVTRGADEFNSLFNSARAVFLAGETSVAFNSTMDQSDLTVTVDNDGVIEELRSLRGEMAEMTERLERMQVVMDTGQLVGVMTDPLDAALGQKQIYRGRGN